jgi:hypothetical protein
VAHRQFAKAPHRDSITGISVNCSFVWKLSAFSFPAARTKSKPLRPGWTAKFNCLYIIHTYDWGGHGRVISTHSSQEQTAVALAEWNIKAQIIMLRYLGERPCPCGFDVSILWRRAILFCYYNVLCLDGRRLPNKFLRKCKSNCFVRAITLSWIRPTGREKELIMC